MLGRSERLVVFGLVLGVVLVGGCGGDEGGGGGGVEDFIGAGWAKFEAGDYSGAIEEFEAGMSDDAGEAHLGLGWSELMLEELESSEEDLSEALALGVLRRQDAHCGLCIVYLALEDFAEAAAHSDSVLALEPGYEFPHRSSVDRLDVHLVRAESYFYMGESYFDRVQESLDVVDPENGLDGDDPSTWIVDGHSYSTYAEALLAEIEYARGLVVE